MHLTDDEIGALEENKAFTRKLESRIKNSAEQKKAAKIIRHLRDDLKKIFPYEAMPSARMINCLVNNCIANDSCGSKTAEHQVGASSRDWDETVTEILQTIADHTQPHSDASSFFFSEDQMTPLFPDNEHFDTQQANTFALLALKYLNVQLGRIDRREYCASV